MRPLLLVLLLVLMGTTARAQNEPVRTSEGEITIPTYPWRGHDDINPSFRWTSAPMYAPVTTTYPYPMQDTLARAKVDQTYKTMVLENEYLKVTVIPELGGHVHQVLDKVTGESMLYENKVIKPSLIGLRGAWSSGGIEFNTGPQGHTVTCLSAVEAEFVEFPDGSKAIAIGNVEQVYHTQWVAIVRLRPGRAALDERIRIYNPTGNRHIYYFWNCVAVPNTPASQLVYPMTLGTDHGGTLFTSWPIHEGRDMSWLKNYDQPTSIFSYRCNQDFYGWYDHAADRGVIAHANHLELTGKKSWTWSRSQWGRRAQASLTDDGSLYNEIQTGPLATQADYGLLEPHMTVEWEEWWRPVRGTKGVAYSTRDVSVNVLRDAASVTVLAHGSGDFDATCAIEGLGEARIKITPERTASAKFPPKDGPLNVKITSGKATLASFTFPLPLPQRTPPENPRALPPDTTAAGCWLRGVQCDKEGGQHVAREWFEKAFQKDPSFAPAMTALGELELEAGQWELARKHLEAAVKLCPDDGWALYYLAQAYVELGRTADALETAAIAARRPESACPAYSLVGSILLAQGELEGAAHFLSMALQKDAQDLVSRDLLAFAYWKAGDLEAAKRELAEVQRRDPLDMPSAIIGTWMGGKPDARIAGRAEEVLDAADFFINGGLRDEAAQVIEQYYLSHVQTKALDPMVAYTHAYLTGLSHPIEASPDYFFPSRRSSFTILEAAVKRDPSDWIARFGLGNLCFERSRKEDAVRLWKEAVQVHDGYSVLHRNLGLVAWKVENRPWEAIGHYEAALRCNPGDFRLYRDLGALYLETGQNLAAARLLERAREKGCSRADVVTLLARAHLEIGEYEQAIALLLADKYTNWEGQLALNALYYAARIGLGEKLFNQGEYAAALKEFEASIEAPENLGAGQMVDAAASEAYYWIGCTQEKLGDSVAALEAFRRAAADTAKGDERNRKFGAAAKERLGSAR
ncbi:MAG: DUF5107 domain-containing protein [Planctomycetota bacterium]